MFSKLLLTAALLPVHAVACSCGGGPRGSNAFERARSAAESSDVIFEGTLERAEIEWKTWRTKQGELISAEPSVTEAALNFSPRMLLTFHVQRAYKGTSDRTIQISTGLGGGDCGRRFSPGIAYLIFASRSTTAGLFTTICSPGGWIGISTIAANLRFLRNEKPTNEDLSLTRVPLWSNADSKAYEPLTGKICGEVVPPTPNGIVAFLPAIGFSPWDQPETLLNRDGSFCSDPLGPGKYTVLFTGGGTQSDIENPPAVEVSAGHTEFNLILKASPQERHSIEGFVFVHSKTGPPPEGVGIALIPINGNRGALFMGATVHRPFAKVMLFNFASVPPGRYLIAVSVPAKDWYVKRTEVTITTHPKLISLNLIHKG